MRFPNRTGFAKKGEKLHNFLKLNGSADRTTRLKPLSSNGWSPPSPAEDDMNKRRHAGTLPNRFLVVVRKWRIASDKKSAEIRRNTPAKTPSNTQKYPSKNTPSKNTRSYRRNCTWDGCLGVSVSDAWDASRANILADVRF